MQVSTTHDNPPAADPFLALVAKDLVDRGIPAQEIRSLDLGGSVTADLAGAMKAEYAAAEADAEPEADLG